MSRMNGRTRKRLFSFLAVRDGEYCSICKHVGSFKTLVIDHKDNNNANNDTDNLQLLCRSCNGRKNPRGKAKPKNGSVEIDETPTTRTIILNRQYLPKFREYVEKQVETFRRVPLEDLINSGAEITGASVVTIRRYLPPLCSTAGKFRVTHSNGIDYLEFKELWNANE
jgi:HNH endonuclease